MSADSPRVAEPDLLQEIIETVPSGVVHLAPDGAFRLANRRALAFLGMSWDGIRQRYVRDFAGETYRDDGSPCPVEEYPAVQCLATGEPAGPATIGVRQPDGELRWAIFSAVPIAVPDHERTGAIVTFVDITERKQSELRARIQQQLLDSARLVHFADDPDTTTRVFADPLGALLELTGSLAGFIARVDDAAPSDELLVLAHIDREHRDAGHASQPPLPIDPLSERALETGAPVFADEPGALGPFFRRAPNRAVVYPLEAAGRVVGLLGLADAPTSYEASNAGLDPLLTACGHLVGAVIERRKKARLEAQLARAERLASVGTLAAGTAHEINNPLAYVLLNLEAYTRYAEKLQTKIGEVRERLRERLGEEGPALLGPIADDATWARLTRHGTDASEGAERVRRIVRDLMTFARVSEETRGLVDINAAVRIALKMAHHEIKYRARLTTELGEIPAVLGHEGRLSQVILNLLLNAARAIEEGRPDANEVCVRTWTSEDRVWIEVRDTGMGIAPDHRERLFEPFFSTRAPGSGSGLGLSICHSVVQSHGGEIDVQSEQGVGSRFLVALPRARTSERPDEGRPEPAPTDAARSGQRLLLVDDEPMVLRVLTQLLSRSYEVETAEGYEAALELLSSRPESFDAVVCDMMLLDGTGMDLHRWIRKHAPALAPRVVFMTGGAFTPRARRFLDQHGAPYLTKPFSMKELVAALNRTVEAASGARG